VSVPDEVRTQLKLKLWQEADQIGWVNLKTSQKSKFYERWTRDAEIGAVLAHFMNHMHVRVYIKDTLLKGYNGEHNSDPSVPLKALSIPVEAQFIESYVKPHGRLLRDRRLICWGRAEGWQHVLMAVYERSYGKNIRPYAAVLCNARARFNDSAAREMIELAATKLGIEEVKWLEE